MLRFILNFILFGLLFYAISYYFPDAFEGLLNSAKIAFTYIKEFVQILGDRLNSLSSGAPAPSVPAPPTSP